MRWTSEKGLARRLNQVCNYIQILEHIFIDISWWSESKRARHDNSTKPDPPDPLDTSHHPFVQTLLAFKTLQQLCPEVPEPPSVPQKKPVRSTVREKKHLSFSAPTSTFDDGKGVYVVDNETFGFTYLHDVGFNLLQMGYGLQSDLQTSLNSKLPNFFSRHWSVMRMQARRGMALFMLWKWTNSQAWIPYNVEICSNIHWFSWVQSQLQRLTWTSGCGHPFHCVTDFNCLGTHIGWRLCLFRLQTVHTSPRSL